MSSKFKSAERAADYASQWGDTDSDCVGFYNLTNRCEVRSEEHRDQCLRAVTQCEADVRNRPEWYERDELKSLAKLRANLITAYVVGSRRYMGF